MARLADSRSDQRHRGGVAGASEWAATRSAGRNSTRARIHVWGGTDCMVCGTAFQVHSRAFRHAASRESPEHLANAWAHVSAVDPGPIVAQGVREGEVPVLRRRRAARRSICVLICAITSK